MKKYVWSIAIAVTVSLFVIGCSANDDNETENTANDSTPVEEDDTEQSHAERGDFHADDFVAIRTAKAGDQAENKVFEHADAMGYYDVLDDFEGSTEFSAGEIDFSINNILLAAFVPYEGTTLSGVDHFPMRSIILVIDTDTDAEHLSSPDLYMAAMSAEMQTQGGEELDLVSDLNPQTVGSESESSLNVFKMDEAVNPEDISRITFTLDPRAWSDQATEVDIVTKDIDLN